MIEASSPAVTGDSTEKSDYWILTGLLSLTGIAALCFFYRRNEILLSGDAVAHINIARRVFDSLTPGPMQLGTVWLPLPHLLTIPFLVIKGMWQSGIGGSVVSIVSYVVAGMGMFRLMSIWSRWAAWLGTIIFASNPSLLYVQTTALNEPLYLACFLWTVVFFVEATRCLRLGRMVAAGSALEKGAITLAASTLTRYDGWFLAFTCWAAMIPIAFTALRAGNAAVGISTPLGGPLKLGALRKSISKALLLTALAPTLWLACNFGAKGNAFDFANGPYSAKAIAQRTTSQDSAPYPGKDHPITAAIYFTKAAQLIVGENLSSQLLLAVAALASLAFALRRDWLPITLLWSPLPFYSLSIAYGAVPIFLPVWWPFSYYNVRYGLELLPAIAAGAGIAFAVVAQSWRTPRAATISKAAVVLLVLLSYLSSWKATPICLRETRANGSARMEADRRLAGVLESLPRGSTILTYTGSHSGAFEIANFPLRQTVNEGVFAVWENALHHPATAADYVIASSDDPVAGAVAAHPEKLTPIASIEVKGQPRIVIYKSSGH